MLVILFFFTGEEYIKNRQEAEANKTISGAKYEPADEFDVDAYPALNELIKTYFEAYVAADFEALAEVATPLSDMEKSYISTMSQYYEEYRNIKCYSKQGLSKNAYIVAVTFDIKFADYDMVAPSLLTFYVQTNSEGQLYINNLYSDFNIHYSEVPVLKDVYTAVRKFLNHDDYISLYLEVENAYHTLIREDKGLYDLVEGTLKVVRKEWADNVFYAQETETSTETGTETGTENSTEGTESSTEAENSTEQSTQTAS
jgi:hypothetical protein